VTADEARRERTQGLRAPGRARLRGRSPCRRACPSALTVITQRSRLADGSPRA
jgi:hypothetical protein